MGGATRGIVVGVVCVPVMGLFADIHLHNIWLILFHGVAGSIFMSTVGVLGAIWADKFDHMAAVTNFVITPLTFLSGTFYTIDRLPEWAQLIAHFNPFFYNIDGFRHGFLGHDAVSPAIGVAVMAVLDIALFAWTYFVIRSGYKLKP
jgi:ABC-2 type transport system permease protein